MEQNKILSMIMNQSVRFPNKFENYKDTFFHSIFIQMVKWNLKITFKTELLSHGFDQLYFTLTRVYN